MRLYITVIGAGVMPIRSLCGRKWLIMISDSNEMIGKYKISRHTIKVCLLFFICAEALPAYRRLVMFSKQNLESYL